MPPNSTKEDILARSLEFGLTAQNQNLERLKKSLGANLKKNHPIHCQVEELPNPQLKKLCDKLSLTGHNWYRPRMQTKIKTYFFKNFPEGPLTALQEALDPKPGQASGSIINRLL